MLASDVRILKNRPGIYLRPPGEPRDIQIGGEIHHLRNVCELSCLEGNRGPKAICLRCRVAALVLNGDSAIALQRRRAENTRSGTRIANRQLLDNYRLVEVSARVSRRKSW